MQDLKQGELSPQREPQPVEAAPLDDVKPDSEPMGVCERSYMPHIRNTHGGFHPICIDFEAKASSVQPEEESEPEFDAWWERYRHTWNPPIANDSDFFEVALEAWKAYPHSAPTLTRDDGEESKLPPLATPSSLYPERHRVAYNDCVTVCAEGDHEWTKKQRDALADFIVILLDELEQRERYILDLPSPSPIPASQPDTGAERLRSRMLGLVDGFRAGQSSEFSDGLKEAAHLLRTDGVLLPIVVGETHHDHIIRFALAFAEKLEKLAAVPEPKVIPAGQKGDETPNWMLMVDEVVAEWGQPLYSMTEDGEAWYWCFADHDLPVADNLSELLVAAAQLTAQALTKQAHGNGENLS